MNESAHRKELHTKSIVDEMSEEWMGVSWDELQPLASVRKQQPKDRTTVTLEIKNISRSLVPETEYPRLTSYKRVCRRELETHLWERASLQDVPPVNKTFVTTWNDHLVLRGYSVSKYENPPPRGRSRQGLPGQTPSDVRVNDLFVEVTIDASFTTEQAVTGHIDEIHILNTVRAEPIVGYLSPSQICDTCALLHTKNLDMEMPPDTLEDFLTTASVPWCESTSSLPFLICPSRPRWFFVVEIFLFTNSRPIYRWIVDVRYTLTSEFMFSWMCVRWVGW
jgi:hypothetical protein